MDNVVFTQCTLHTKDLLQKRLIDENVSREDPIVRVLIGLHIPVGINGSTLVNLQALPRWSVCPLTGRALATCAFGYRRVPIMVL